jgi:hypothetical protein
MNSMAAKQYHGMGRPFLSTALPAKALRQYPVV